MKILHAVKHITNLEIQKKIIINPCIFCLEDRGKIEYPHFPFGQIRCSFHSITNAIEAKDLIEGIERWNEKNPLPTLTKCCGEFPSLHLIHDDQISQRLMCENKDHSFKITKFYPKTPQGAVMMYKEWQSLHKNSVPSTLKNPSKVKNLNIKIAACALCLRENKETYPIMSSKDRAVAVTIKCPIHEGNFSKGIGSVEEQIMDWNERNEQGRKPCCGFRAFHKIIMRDGKAAGQLIKCGSRYCQNTTYEYPLTSEGYKNMEKQWELLIDGEEAKNNGTH